NINEGNKGKGKIEIDFTSEKDLNRILAMLDVNID
ncbi:Stage 0 sporulation protein J, partial [Lacticaseibacillus paracasei subsp. paracasei Lpp126]